MDRMQLTLVAAAALFVAVVLGWGLRWIYELLNPPAPPKPKEDSEWAEYAKACEAQRDEAYDKLEGVERDLTNRLNQAQAELSASMEALGDARRAAQDLEAKVTALKASD